MGPARKQKTRFPRKLKKGQGKLPKDTHLIKSNGPSKADIHNEEKLNLMKLPFSEAGPHDNQKFDN